MQYNVRPMTEDDIPRVVDLVYLSWTTSRYNNLTFDRVGAAAMLDLSLTSEDMQAFVIDTAGVVVGVIGLIIVKMPWHIEKFASEQVFTIHPDHRGYKQAMLLLRAYKNWAMMSGACMLHVLVDHGHNEEKIASLYKRAGFVQNGISLAMRV